MSRGRQVDVEKLFAVQAFADFLNFTMDFISKKTGRMSVKAAEGIVKERNDVFIVRLDSHNEPVITCAVSDDKGNTICKKIAIPLNEEDKKFLSSHSHFSMENIFFAPHLDKNITNIKDIKIQDMQNMQKIVSDWIKGDFFEKFTKDFKDILSSLYREYKETKEESPLNLRAGLAQDIREVKNKDGENLFFKGDKEHRVYFCPSERSENKINVYFRGKDDKYQKHEILFMRDPKNIYGDLKKIVSILQSQGRDHFDVKDFFWATPPFDLSKVGSLSPIFEGAKEGYLKTLSLPLHFFEAFIFNQNVNNETQSSEMKNSTSTQAIDETVKTGEKNEWVNPEEIFRDKIYDQAEMALLNIKAIPETAMEDMRSNKEKISSFRSGEYFLRRNENNQISLEFINEKKIFQSIPVSVPTIADTENTLRAIVGALKTLYSYVHAFQLEAKQIKMISTANLTLLLPFLREAKTINSENPTTSSMTLTPALIENLLQTDMNALHPNLAELTEQKRVFYFIVNNQDNPKEYYVMFVNLWKEGNNLDYVIVNDSTKIQSFKSAMSEIKNKLHLNEMSLPAFEKCFYPLNAEELQIIKMNVTGERELDDPVDPKKGKYVEVNVNDFQREREKMMGVYVEGLDVEKRGQQEDNPRNSQSFFKKTKQREQTEQTVSPQSHPESKK